MRREFAPRPSLFSPPALGVAHHGDFSSEDWREELLGFCAARACRRAAVWSPLFRPWCRAARPPPRHPSLGLSLWSAPKTQSPPERRRSAYCVFLQAAISPALSSDW